ncbi:MAG: uroporphyrin-III C-methyltransferase [Desulfomicrobiaceae bacterium]|jgi:uroporphyrinogen III methyltransferase/synthase|nr:uroporphyrinogen-III C-methyltransferase [Desulfomicrobiaceae bacterium]MBZ4685513.1 uroporphyrin-III C-methyltransferase [Desulfomicrobiaceae bacterium]
MAKAYLIGAGPGDPGLITVKGQRLLAEADVVIYDYLASPELLAVCREDAECIYVGKKGGDHTLPQEEINALIVAKVREGKNVARLKGGDPYIFGRGAEEAEELLAAGLEFEVVPGVTSAVAGPAYAGIPLTHRKYASSVSFITGHEDPTKPDSAHNWQALATGTSTLCFFMGVKNLPYITGQLLKHGMRPDMPAALVRWGTTPRHRSWVSTVAEIADVAAREKIQAPSMLVVGEVVRLRDTLNWFERQPLFGKGVVITRAREQASDLKEQLQRQGAFCHEFPTIAVRPCWDTPQTREAIAHLAEFGWVVFTSVNGVRAFWDALAACGRDSRALAGCRVAAIGPATAQELTQRGIVPDFVPERFVAESALEGLLARGAASGAVLIPRARVARDVLPQGLSQAGARVEVLPMYETHLAEADAASTLELLREGMLHYVTFTSSSTVENFFALLAPEVLRPFVDQGLRLACIGPVTAATLERFGFSAHVQPSDYTIPALVQALVEDAA